jgi:hypothetical protein
LLARAREDFLFKPIAQSVPLYVKVVARLEVQPEPIRGAEVTGEPKGGVSGDGALAVDNLIDASRRNADVLGESVLTNAHRLEELLEQDLARMNRR